MYVIQIYIYIYIYVCVCMYVVKNCIMGHDYNHRTYEIDWNQNMGQKYKTPAGLRTGDEGPVQSSFNGENDHHYDLN